MKSIRHTLIVYFLVLLTGALAAVSWSSYRTTAQALRQRQNDSRQLIEKNCDSRCTEAHAELKRRILQQAVTMSDTRLSTIHYEVTHSLGLLGPSTMAPGLLGALAWGPRPDPSNKAFPFYASLMIAADMPLALLGYAPLPAFNISRNPDPMPPVKETISQVPVYGPIWLYQAKGPQVLSRAFPRNTNIEFAEALVAIADSDHPQEYFQTYTQAGQPMQRSASMGDVWFSLDKEILKPNHLYEYDQVELKPGIKVQRVTIRTSMSFQGVPWWPNPPRGKGPGKGIGPPLGPPRPPPGNPSRNVYIQYAADMSLLAEKTHRFQRERDGQIADLETAIEQELAELRLRMFWISLGTLVAILLGGYAVIRLGLAPLAKMSDAVRQISPTNFHLALDPDKLPNELQPIATRIEESLQELRKAFAREKQAAADISHELRTPLAALMTTLEVGLKKNRSIAEYIEILDECRLSGQHMYQLVERLLTLARLDAGADQYRPGEVDVTEIALNCADLIRPLARARGLDLRLHLPDLVTTRTDGNKLREVLVNLLHNAVEYNRPHGSIEMSIERINGHVRLEVRDSGIGIKPDVMSHIFERFYRADSSRHADTPHAGLGLAIVKSYVELMGGTIRVESSDAGTAFIVELPFVQTAITAIREPVRA